MSQFGVTGSTGNPYIVTLTDSARKCQCLDHRMRKHDCKHIRLVLNSIGAAEAPKEWRAALERQFAAAVAATAAGAAGDGSSQGGEVTTSGKGKGLNETAQQLALKLARAEGASVAEKFM